MLDALTLQLGYNATLVTLGAMLLGMATGATGTFLFLRKRALVSDAVAQLRGDPDDPARWEHFPGGLMLMPLADPVLDALEAIGEPAAIAAIAEAAGVRATSAGDSPVMKVRSTYRWTAGQPLPTRSCSTRPMDRWTQRFASAIFTASACSCCWGRTAKRRRRRYSLR